MRHADNKYNKFLLSNNYNFIFSKKTGYFVRWGKTLEDDPIFSPFGPEILDIEITTICSGIKNPEGTRKPCEHCYKSNTSIGKNMSLNDFKHIINVFPKKTLTQIAIGADATATSNPELWNMMEYTRSLGVIPNITVADVSDEVADNLAKLCGAVAVSRYENKDVCYDSIKKLTDRGMKQVNIHILVSEETKSQILETFNDYKTDDRLSKLNAIVLLHLKKKGRGVCYNYISDKDFAYIVQYALTNNIPLGFDSCSCNKFLSVVKNNDNYQQLAQSSEPCESSIFSSYVSCDGMFFPCSFSENDSDGLNVLECESEQDFLDKIWFHEKTIAWRNKLLENNRNCPIYQI